ncbi:MAG: YfhO family protein, partial [Ruminococcus sp.]|nr:YfhO family protein [Ruminococcus sp.]
DNVYESVSEDNFFRVDISKDYDNYPMLWGLPSMRAFQSVVESSIMNFYPNVDITRDVASRPDTTHYTLRGLFSVKYYYQHKDTNDNDKIDIPSELPGFEYVSENEYFEIYENSLYIPMGMAFDTFITESELENKSKSIREKTLIHSLVLNDEQAEKYGDILKKSDISDISSLTKKSYEEICRKRQENPSTAFRYDSKGFESEITLDKPSLVFYSVPYSDGWSVEVNGKSAEVEKVSYGFMAVKADTGQNIITFRYRTPALTAGIIITLSGIAGLVIYLIICRKVRRKNEKYNMSHYYDYNSCHKINAHTQYCENLIRKK